MARSDKRFSIYPSRDAVDFFGSTTPALNQAVECWYTALKNAELHGLDEAEWTRLEDVLEGKKIDPSFPRPGEILAQFFEHEDLADKLKNLDYVQAWAVILKIKTERIIHET